MRTREQFIKRIEAKLNIESFEDYLRDLYVNKLKTVREISIFIYGHDNNNKTVRNFLKYFNIPVRCGGEAIKVQWIGERGNKRKELSKDIANTYLNSEENRNKLKEIMQTKEYREKQRQCKLGDKNGMYGITRENHPNWNPNLTDEERENGRSIEGYSDFSKKVLARDHYTCQCCGQEHGDLNAHHLDGYDWCKDKRTDETNGITLCKNCHKNFHSLYSYGNNTKEQFQEWIGHAIEVLKFKGKLQTTRKIYCIEEDKVYDSVKDFIKKWGLKDSSGIYDVCNKKEQVRKVKRKDGSTYTRKYMSRTIKGFHVEWYNENSIHI